MNKIRIIVIAIFLSTMCVAERPLVYTQFEVGGGANLLMPRKDYYNGWGYGLETSWSFSPTYGINLTFGSSQIKSKQDESFKTVTSLVGSAELSYRKREPVTGFTTIGIGAVSGEEDALFVFGVGIKIPVVKNWLIRLELRDYHQEIGIPFVTFPESRAVVQGKGSRYLELRINFSTTFGEKYIE